VSISPITINAIPVFFIFIDLYYMVCVNISLQR
jgi:hypothetical protein